MRNYLSLSDCVKSIILAAKKQNDFNYNTINVSSGKNLDNIFIISKLLKILSVNSKVILTDKPAPILNLTMNINKAKKVLGFMPETLDKSLKSYLKKFKII